MASPASLLQTLGSRRELTLEQWREVLSHVEQLPVAQLVPRGVEPPEKRLLALLALCAPRQASPPSADVAAALASLCRRVAQCSVAYSAVWEPRSCSWQWAKYLFSRALSIEYQSPREWARDMTLLDAFDCARQLGVLADVLALLQREAPMHPALAACLPFAWAQQGSLQIFGHRFDPCVHPENTREAFMYAATELKVDGMEVDICLTADGHLVCTHDRMPPNFMAGGDSLYSWLRVHGFETWFYADEGFLATTDILPHGHKPSEQLSLHDLRGSRKLRSLTSKAHLPHEIPTLDQIAALMAQMVRDGVRSQPFLWLDFKLPESEPHLDMVARELGAIVERHGLDASRFVLGSGSGVVLDTLLRRVRVHFPHLVFLATQGDFMIGPWEKAEGHKLAAENLARSEPNMVMDIGRVLYGPLDPFLHAARAAARAVADKQSQHGNQLRLCFWTLNDELLLRKCLALLEGQDTYHWVITDNVELVRTVLRKAQPKL